MAQTTTQKAPIFEAPDKPLNVSATGVEQIARAGARAGQLGNEVRSLDIQGGTALARGVDSAGKDLGNAIQTHQNILDLNNINTAHASTLLSLTQAQQKFFSDPANTNNPEAVNQFNEQFVQPAADALNNLAQTKAGQEHAANLTGALEDHFVQTSATTHAAVAAQQTKNSLAYVSQALSSAAQQNPGNIPAALSTFDTMMQGYSAQHPEINIAKDNPERMAARREIVASGIAALIDKTVQDTGQAPDLKGYFSQYGQELGGKEQQALQEHADARVKAYNKQAAQDAATSRTIETDAARQAATKLSTSVIQLGPDGTPTGSLAVPKDFYANVLKLGNMDGATEAQVKSSIALADKLKNDPPGSKGAHDDATFNTMLHNAYLPEGDPNRLTYTQLNEWRSQDKLTNAEFTAGNEMVKRNEQQTGLFDKQLVSAGVNSARIALNPLGNDPDGADKFKNFQTWFLPQLHALTTGPKAMSTADAVRTLVTPANIALHGVASPTAPQSSASAPIPPAAGGQDAPSVAARGIGNFFKGLFQ